MEKKVKAVTVHVINVSVINKHFLKLTFIKLENKFNNHDCARKQTNILVITKSNNINFRNTQRVKHISFILILSSNQSHICHNLNSHPVFLIFSLISLVILMKMARWNFWHSKH